MEIESLPRVEFKKSATMNRVSINQGRVPRAYSLTRIWYAVSSPPISRLHESEINKLSTNQNKLYHPRVVDMMLSRRGD